LDPENSYAWDLLSWALGYEQPPDAAGAEKAARESLRLEPALYPKTYYHLGRALMFQQRYPEAIAAFEHSRTDPEDSFPDLGMGQVYLAQGDYDKALAAYQRALDRRASTISGWVRPMRLAATERKLSPRCKKHLTQAFTTSPRSIPVRTSLRCAPTRASSN
jgi:tetratricopeptide (TPR) repeat protein